MRASFVFSEVLTGLRRNITMTIAMILTTAISLGLLGGGLLIVRTIDKMQDIYYDKVEVAVYLTDEVSANDKECTQQPCAGLRSQIEQTSGVDTVTYENRDQVYERFKQMFQAQPELLDLTRPESLPATIRVKLDDPERSDVLIKAFEGQQGVKKIDDQGTLLSRLFDVLNGVRNGAFAIALVQALAALLLISNTIQVSAYTRRTEVGIMRLVGATRWYTQLPFLIEAVVAGLIGAILAVVGLGLAKTFFLDSALAGPIKSGIIPAVDFLDILYVSPYLFLVAAGISAITGYVTLRMYVRL
ncbi:permease-like cell division protein FtsX [Goodfellowiella coeruleoviolacea]|uniref:Cell division protein FtsX n=1 Tax=Goodfellowiella coeruleoviolacea TaxID=334858 RepID=A0AAE3GI73_9PSEU|nr:permease-like cell division protein FtsX [Goodfellowiella coeruleoviolacea]MCP2167910.1 cell division transport system permease protein [Goodfellowiella coeruleoviolacea]